SRLINQQQQRSVPRPFVPNDGAGRACRPADRKSGRYGNCRLVGWLATVQLAGDWWSKVGFAMAIKHSIRLKWSGTIF
ncbi:hypothetical protein, partial [Mesorhizobium sp. M7A.F.Ca.CA.001.09.1.1]|uniref:hypothetical protein n=1 Tax=Mesorhizobium sp. M7A.F.Ca.CA.001.09.1.1 TaxID=2496718 RepID=UPI0019D1E8FD